MRHLVLPSALALVAGCGASPDAEKKGPDYCQIATQELQKVLGPEFDKVVTGRRLPPQGCALVYRQVQEEFAGEVAGESSNGFTDQRLAILLPDSRGKPSLELVGGSEPAPGPVMIELTSREVTGEAPAELVINESSAPDYKGVRIFTYGADAASLKEILAANLKVKTPEGLEIAATWRMGDFKGAKAVILDGAGSKKIFTWNRAAGRYTYNEVATNELAPKPAAPPSEAPAEVALPGDDAGEPKKAPAAEKKVPVKKAAEAAAKKAADEAAEKAKQGAKKQGAKKQGGEKEDTLNLGELNL